MSLNIRTTKPEKGNKYYNTKSKGGYSSCILGKPTQDGLTVLSNCVGNACAGFNEEHGFGYEKYHLTCNAENFIERAVASGLSVYKDPMVGGILVWQKGTLASSDGAGHVEIVIEILARDSAGHPTKIRTHSSGYGNSNPWWTSVRSIGNGNWGCNSPYAYRGCIAPEGYTPGPQPEPPKPEPVTPTKFKIGDKVIINGSLYKSSDAAKPSGSVSNKVTEITRVVTAAHPYNTKGDLGWMNESDIQLYVEPPKPEPVVETFKVGDKVVPTRLVNYTGTKLRQYDKFYTISQLNGDRAVLTARGQVWAAMNTADITHYNG